MVIYFVGTNARVVLECPYQEIDDAQSECNLCGCTSLDNDELEYRIEDARRRMKSLTIN